MKQLKERYLLNVWMPGVPPKATAQHKGAVRTKDSIRFYEKKEVRSARETLMGMLRPHVPKEPFDGALHVTIQLIWPHLKSAKKQVRDESFVPMVTTPDVDNSAKLFLDVMTSMGFWKDDSQVWSLTVRKFRGTNAGINLGIMESYLA